MPKAVHVDTSSGFILILLILLKAGFMVHRDAVYFGSIVDEGKVEGISVIRCYDCWSSLLYVRKPSTDQGCLYR